MENVDLEEPTTFLEHVLFGIHSIGTRMPNASAIAEHRKMFESRISAGETEKVHGWEKLHEKRSRGSYDVEGHAKKCVERHCELANKKDRALLQCLKNLLQKYALICF